MLIDTHAHLWWKSYVGEEDEVVRRAEAAGVERVVVPGVDVETSKKAVELAGQYPGVVFAAVGIHPEQAGADSLDKQGDLSEEIARLRRLIEENRRVVVAVGEVGIDLSTEELRERFREQEETFEAQCLVAIEYGLPVIVHTRESLHETLEVVDRLTSVPRGQFHCFSHDRRGLDSILERGFYVSFCGNITWSKRVRELVKLVPMDLLLLETDSPFMTPRGEESEVGLRNEPANVRILAQIQASLRGEGEEEFIKYTGENARRLFQI